ncbi:MAG: hypothetical protein ABUU24_05755, partial [Variovorax sp.]
MGVPAGSGRRAVVGLDQATIDARGAQATEDGRVGQERLRQLEEANRSLEQEVVQHRMAAELARGQSEMLIQSLNFLAAESNLDKFLGHVLKVTVQQLQGVGGTLWFPDHANGSIRLHLEFLDSRVIPASESHHPAVLHPLPIG